MTKPSSSLYSCRHLDVKERIADRIAEGCRQSKSSPLVFFRADDIGIPSHRFSQLIGCFQKHRLPLCLATVPAWITAERFSVIRRLSGADSSQWCWHQHGRVHRNFEKIGKEQEFGPARTREEIYNSLTKGRRRLEDILDGFFYPVFTPPWNRCSDDTLRTLEALSFKAVSRSRGATPITVHNLPDFQVNVDLHTRKELAPDIAFENLLTEIEQSLASGLCGIMIHHQRMNGAALELLDILLGLLKINRELTPVHFRDLVIKEGLSD
jgi:hypothetical protein